MVIVLFVIGLVLLVLGAELLVRGASKLALAAGISPLVIGLTVVAFGTSSPELAVSVNSALSGVSDIAIGNVIGSNIFNVLVILGLSAMVTPLLVHRQLIWVDVPIMVGVSGLAWWMAVDGTISRLEGAILFALLVGYFAMAVKLGRKEGIGAEEIDGPPPRGFGALAFQIALIAVGLGMLVVGARWLVNGAVTAAEAMGVSELVISLTIVAAGTSLPEVATSLIAAVRGQRDMAVGNAVGSNLLNLMAIFGVTAMIEPIGAATQAITFDFPVMFAVAVACAPIFFTGHVIARWEGFVFVAYYVLYAVNVFLSVTDHEALPTYQAAMVQFVIPLTVLTLVLTSYRAWRAHGLKPPPQA